MYNLDSRVMNGTIDCVLFSNSEGCLTADESLDWMKYSARTHSSSLLMVRLS